ncbi:MAG: low molecular weight protein arginine phosphatase [Chloroflexi bacterium]|nr:low molecular weight protein arginine phosphatase [Chloroflexota bacterium]
MPQILLVCTANVCRSPVVAALLKQRLQEQGYDDWVVKSSGTWATLSRSASQYSIELMAERNIDIYNHRAQMIDESLLRESDLVLCMAEGHVEALQIEFSTYRTKIYTLSEMVGKRYSISDPYGGPRSAYEDMVAEVSQLVDVGFEQIVALAKENSRKRAG